MTLIQLKDSIAHYQQTENDLYFHEQRQLQLFHAFIIRLLRVQRAQNPYWSIKYPLKRLMQKLMVDSRLLYQSEMCPASMTLINKLYVHKSMLEV